MGKREFGAAHHHVASIQQIEIHSAWRVMLVCVRPSKEDFNALQFIEHDQGLHFGCDFDDGIVERLGSRRTVHRICFIDGRSGDEVRTGSEAQDCAERALQMLQTLTEVRAEGDAEGHARSSTFRWHQHDGDNLKIELRTDHFNSSTSCMS
jgi:hypothetical protein